MTTSSSTRPRWFHQLSKAAGLLLCLQTVQAQSSVQNDIPSVTAVLSQTTSQAQMQEFTGSFQAVLRSEVSAAQPGLVKDVQVDAGATVQTGQLLGSLDDRLARTVRDERAASLAQAKAELTEQQRLVTEAAKVVQGASLPATELRRREAELAKAQAQHASAQAQLAQAEIILSQHQIKAPFHGVVSRRYAMPGQWRQPGEPLFDLVALDKLWLDVDIPQQFYDQVAALQSAEVWPDQHPGLKLVLPVSARIPVGQQSSRAFRLRFLQHNQPGPAAILPGTSAKVRFALAAQPLSRLPASALLRQPDGAYAVWYLPADAVAGSVYPVRRQLVELVSQQDKQVLIKGLPEQVLVLVSGQQQLTLASTVRLQSLSGE